MMKRKAKKQSEAVLLPLLPLRDLVMFPGVVVPLLVGREKSMEALDLAMKSDQRRIFVVAQRDMDCELPGVDDLYSVGVVGTILQLLKIQNKKQNVVKFLIEGETRAILQAPKGEGGELSAQMYVQLLDSESAPTAKNADHEKIQKQLQSLLKSLHDFSGNSDKLPDNFVNEVRSIDDPGRAADMAASAFPLELNIKQDILEETDVLARLEKLNTQINIESSVQDIDKRVSHRVKNQMERMQREYYLNEKMKAIQKELGSISGNGEGETEQIERRLRKSGMSAPVLKKALAELEKFKMMTPMSAEASVLRSYLDWLINVPWKKRTRLKHDIVHAHKILNSEHYALEEVKDRILEYLAVQQRVRQVRGSIICLVGAPGVGKTSLGESIARATNRKFVRLSLGGMHDEGEIRGHRRTYIGSLPGKIVQKMSEAGVVNPLFLLDEVDKMGGDYRGDPAAALLEVLDPEQNRHFNDHYLEVNYNLSEVMFICTANSMNIPAPLLDRMEVIRLSGYTEDEKMEIATRYLLPKAMKNCGLLEEELQISSTVLRDIIRYYTYEAGVRSLEREIEKICRKTVLEQTMRTAKKTRGAVKTYCRRITANNLKSYCGVRRYDYGITDTENRIGQVKGLAWTSAGGDLLTIEAAVTPGSARQVLTGSLGDVMKESIQTAMTVIRSRAAGFGIKDNFLESSDVHVHVPEGATPKDGPSAGIGMCTALLSALSKIPVRKDVAMTGEITLQGRVLSIGALKEKLLAARRGGISQVVIPADNLPDLEEIPANILKSLDVKAVSWIDEALEIALEKIPEVDVKVDIPEALPRSEEQKNSGIGAHH